MALSPEEKDRYDSQAASFVKTINANVDNERLTDAEFRQFIRNSMQVFPQWYLIPKR